MSNTNPVALARVFFAGAFPLFGKGLILVLLLLIA
jgi:hypothetical protein